MKKKHSESFIRNCIVEQNKNNDFPIFTFTVKGKPILRLDSMIVIPIYRLNNIFSWIRTFLKYHKIKKDIDEGKRPANKM